jgi:hypothetical protein
VGTGQHDTIRSGDQVRRIWNLSDISCQMALYFQVLQSCQKNLEISCQNNQTAWCHMTMHMITDKGTAAAAALEFQGCQ